MVRRKGGRCILAVLACSLASVAAALLLDAEGAQPALTLRRASAVDYVSLSQLAKAGISLAKCDNVGTSPGLSLRLKGGGRLNIDQRPEDKSDTQMAEDEALKATLKKVISKNRPIAQQSTSDDNSIISMHPKRMEDLGFFNGDTVLLKGRRGRETVCVVVPEEKMEEEHIGLSKNALDWLRLAVNTDRVKVAQFPDIKNAKRVHVLPFKYSMGSFEGDVFDMFLKPYFFENYRPVHAGEVFPVHSKELDVTLSFKVMQIDDEETKYGVVAPETVVYTEGEPLERDADPSYNPTEIGYDDIGGLTKQINQVSSCCYLRLVRPRYIVV